MSSVRSSERPRLVDSTVVIACGDAATDLAGHIRAVLRRGARNVVVDFGDAEMVDASTLALLRQIGGELRSRGGGLSVVSANRGLSSLLHMTLLSQSFRVFASLDAALLAAL